MEANDIDRGWAWVVMCASFGAQFIGGILTYGTGVFLVGLLNKYEGAVATTSLVGAIYASLFALMGPLASFLINRYSCRVAVITGGVLGMAGFTLSFLIKKLELLIITYSIMAGTGTSLCCIPAVVVVGFSFKRYLGMAVGFNVTGAGLGMFASGPLTQLVLDTYGVNGAFLLMAGLISHAIIFGALMRPSSLEIDNKKRLRNADQQSNGCLQTISNKMSIFKNRSFSIMLSTFCIWNLPYSLVLLHLPNYAFTKGISETDAALLITMIGLGSTFSRVLSGLTLGPGGIDPMLMYIGLLGLCGTLTLTFPLYSSAYAGQIVYSLFFGVYTGGIMVLLNPVAIELVGLSHLPVAIGLMFAMSGVGSIFGPPLAGYIVDSGGDYEYSFYISGGCFVTASLLSLVSVSFRHEIPTEMKASSIIDLKGSRFLSASFMFSGSLELVHLAEGHDKESSYYIKSSSHIRDENLTSDASSRQSYESLNLPRSFKMANGNFLTAPEKSSASLNPQELIPLEADQ